MSDPVFDQARELIDTQIERLERGGDLCAGEVHDLRVATKQLRSYLRLYATVRPGPMIGQVDRQLKTIADAFSGLRDGHVQVKTLDRILRGQPHVMLQIRRLYDDLERAPDHVPIPDLSVISEKFTQVRTSWERDLACDDDAFLGQGLEATYEKSRRLGKRALRKDVDEMFHRWRKWEKYWLYQLSAAHVPVSGRCRKYVKDLSDLGSKLGRYHDYCVLESTVRHRKGSFEDPRAAGLVLERIERRKENLKTYFASRYKKLFPGDFEKCRRKKLGGGED